MIDADAEGKFFVRPSEKGDAMRLAPHMRWEDKVEISCLGRNPREALESGFEFSYYCLTGMSRESGLPVCMFGVVRDYSAPYSGYIWMLGSKSLDEIPLTFLRNSKRWLRFLQEDFRYTHNLVMASNALHVKWLKWLGANLDYDINIRNEKFHHFTFNNV